MDGDAGPPGAGTARGGVCRSGERTALDGSQTVLCLFNFTAGLVPIVDQERLAELFPDGSTRDLLGGSELDFPAGGLELRPYQALWLVAR